MSAKQLMHVEVDRKQLDRALSLLKHLPGGVQKASKRAIGAALTAGRTRAAREVPKFYALADAKDRVKVSFSVRKSANNALVGELTSRGPGLPFHEFEHAPNTGDTTGRKRTQIRVTIKKGSSFGMRTGFRYNGKIFRRIPVKHSGWDKNLEIPYSVSIPQMVGHPQIAPQVQERMQEQFEKRLDNQVTHLLNGGK